MNIVCHEVGLAVYDLMRDVVQSEAAASQANFEYYVENGSTEFTVSIGPTRGRWKVTVERIQDEG